MNTMLPIAKRGEAILELVAAPISSLEFNSRWLDYLAEVMHRTMHESNGVGIAAPQVYISKRMIIVASRPNERYPDAPEMQPIVMVNPEILEFSKNCELGTEGCLSVEGRRGDVSRAESIRVKYYSVQGQEIIAVFTGFPARIVQHEIDHLNGILFVDRVNENS